MKWWSITGKCRNCGGKAARQADQLTIQFPYIMRSCYHTYKSKIFLIARWLWFQHSTKVKAFVMCEIIWMMSCWLLCFPASCFISDDVLLGYTRHWLHFTQVKTSHLAWCFLLGRCVTGWYQALTPNSGTATFQMWCHLNLNLQIQFEFSNSMLLHLKSVEATKSGIGGIIYIFAQQTWEATTMSVYHKIT